MGTEAELKYACAHALSADELFSHPFVKPFCGEVMRTQMHTVYLDTSERDTRKNGISLRLRKENGVPQLTLKKAKRREGELSVRGEWSVMTDDLGRAAELLEEAGAPVEKIRGKKLSPVAEVEFLRLVARVTPREGFSFELSLDCGVFKKSMTHFSEVELELICGDVCELKKYGAELSRALGLLPEKRSKHARAIL